MRIAIFLPVGIIIGLMLLFVNLPSYLPDEFITIYMFALLFVIFAFVGAGILRGD